MTFLYGTNEECIYSMPAIGVTQTSSALTCLNTAPTAPPLQLPALQNIWSPGNITGRAFKIMAAGGFDLIGANTLTTLRLSFDTASGTTANNTVAATGALSGNAFGAANSAGAWQLLIWMTCTGISSETLSTWFAGGQLQFSGTMTTGVATSYGFGNTITNGVPQTFTLPLQTPLFPNLCAQWQTTVTAMVCSQFIVCGLN